MEEAELGLADGSLPRLRNSRLVLALWLAADQELCCEGLNIRRRGWHICGYRYPYCCPDRSSSRSGWNVDGPCRESLRTGRHRCSLCTTTKKKTRSSLEPQQLSEPQTCFARCDGPRLHYGSVPPPPPCCWSPYGKLWYSRTPGALLLLCCSGTGTRFVDRGTFSSAVITCFHPP